MNLSIRVTKTNHWYKRGQVFKAIRRGYLTHGKDSYAVEDDGQVKYIYTEDVELIDPTKDNPSTDPINKKNAPKTTHKERE